MIANIALFTVGIALLTLGADWLVRGSSRLAHRFGVSNLVIGLTVVAFGTSAPELVVSGSAALNGQPDVAVGNVMGSTVANVGLIVGFGALFRPIRVHRKILVRETPIVIIVLSLVMLLSLNGELGRLDGAILMAGFTMYILFLLKWGGAGLDELAHRVEAQEAESLASEHPEAGYAPEGEASAEGTWRDGTLWAVMQILIGLPFLLFGAHWLIDAALSLALRFGVPDAVIAATMIAIGTSLPELASTSAAAFRGMGDIAIGNVIGSNVFNLGLCLGTAALLRPLLLPPSIVVRQVLPALIFSIALIPLALSKQRVGRAEGAVLLAAYIGFIVWVI